MEKETSYEWTKECQGTLQTVNIHGHEQCVLCHSIVDDCCQGAQLK